MELQQLKYFKTVAEIGKISAAADSLFISAPALSTSIARLEKELGFSLFDRTNNKIILNQQGHIFLKHVSEIFSTLDSAMQEMQQSMLHQGPHISIASINTAMWVNLITAFTSEYPHITLSCSTTMLKTLAETGLPSQHGFLLSTESDVPLSYADELDNIFLFNTYPAVMIHKDHPLAQEDSINLCHLANEKIFMPTVGYSLHTRLMQLFELNNIPVPADNSYSFLARQQMVLENLGISFFSMYSGHNPLPSIRCIPLEDPFGPWSTRLYWRKNHIFTKEEKLFKNFTEHFYNTLHNVHVMQR